jgi:hypothetical protein
LFQVASQFNLLEMTSYEVTPEHGVTRYQYDRTQGPACAIAAGAATVYRNYFVPVGNGYGQTAKRQLDGLAVLGEALSYSLNQPLKALWKMQNGYALCTRAGLDAIANHLGTLAPEQLDILRGKLRIGIQSDVEVTDDTEEPRPSVSQAFCSALPVAYTDNTIASLGAICDFSVGSSIRSNHVGGCAECTARQFQQGFAHIAWRGCLWQRDPMDLFGHSTGPKDSVSV